jgi:hypothetical protein
MVYYGQVADPYGQPVYKIGVTTRGSVKKRYTQESDWKKIRIIKTFPALTSAEAYKLEKETLKKYSMDRYFGPPLLFTGNRELFVRDVLGLDQREDAADGSTPQPGG